MDKQGVEQALKEDLGVKKELVALKPLNEIPSNIPHYEGVATPGLCAQVGEVLGVVAFSRLQRRYGRQGSYRKPDESHCHRSTITIPEPNIPHNFNLSKIPN